MKTLKCDLCDAIAKGETFEEWMKALQPHYMKAHPEVMKKSDHSEEDAKKWMINNKARFDTTPKDLDVEEVKEVKNL